MVKKRILWVEGTAQLGGAQYNHILLQQYRPESWEAFALLPEDGPLVAELERYGVEVRIIRTGPSWSTSFHLGNRTVLNPLALLWLGIQSVFIALPRYYAQIRKIKPDLVVTNSMVAHLFGGIAAWAAGRKRIFRLEDILREGGFFSLVKREFRWFFRRLANGIIVPSKSVRDLNFQHPAILNKTEVIYNSQPFAKDKEVSPVLKQEYGITGPTIGIMSRLTPWKGHRELIGVFKDVVKPYPEARLLIVGGDLFAPGGYLQSLQDMTTELGLQDQVIFTGFRRDLENCIASFDVAVLPSILPDPCPRVLFEFMERSRPIIATPLGGAPEIIEHGKSGVIVNPRNHEALANAITSFLEDPEASKAKGEEARKRLEEEFPFERYLNGHYDYFEQMVSNG